MTNSSLKVQRQLIADVLAGMPWPADVPESVREEATVSESFVALQDELYGVTVYVPRPAIRAAIEIDSMPVVLGASEAFRLSRLLQAAARLASRLDAAPHEWR